MGQTTREWRRRHYGYRSEIKCKSDGLGEPFNADAVETGLDSLEEYLQHIYQCMLKHRGMGIRDETRRRQNGQ